MRPISLASLILLAVAGVATAQIQSPTLEERMSQAEFQASGLGKLSPQELQQLNAWIEANGGGTVKYLGPGGEPAFYTDGDRPDIESTIVGTFEGWRGKTVFTLANEQQWQQAESGGRDTGKFTDPEVRIKPMMMGSWLMYVEGCGCSVRVKRIK